MVEDEKITELFFERSEKAIGELDKKYGGACRSLSYGIVNSRQDAEECVNDAYLGVWNAIPPAKPNPLRAFLFKIVRNISLKAYYKKEAAKRSSPARWRWRKSNRILPTETRPRANWRQKNLPVCWKAFLTR